MSECLTEMAGEGEFEGDSRARTLMTNPRAMRAID